MNKQSMTCLRTKRCFPLMRRDTYFTGAPSQYPQRQELKAMLTKNCMRRMGLVLVLMTGAYGIGCEAPPPQDVTQSEDDPLADLPQQTDSGPVEDDPSSDVSEMDPGSDPAAPPPAFGWCGTLYDKLDYHGGYANMAAGNDAAFKPHSLVVSPGCKIWSKEHSFKASATKPAFVNHVPPEQESATIMHCSCNGAPGPIAAWFYELPNFGGSAFPLYAGFKQNLPGMWWDKKISSFKIVLPGDVVELGKNTNRGGAVRFAHDQANLADTDLDNQASEIRARKEIPECDEPGACYSDRVCGQKLKGKSGNWRHGHNCVDRAGGKSYCTSNLKCVKGTAIISAVGY